MKAYEAAGVDAIFVAGATAKEEVETLGTALSVPLLLGGVPSGELSDREFLASQGVRVALQGHLPFQAAIKAVYDTLEGASGRRGPGRLARHPGDPRSSWTSSPAAPTTTVGPKTFWANPETP